MVAQTKRVLMATSLLLLAILACQPGPPPAPTANATAGPNLALTLTALVQTVSAVPVSVSPSATLPSEASPTATGVPPILTATFTVIPSPTVPLASVTKGTNCRSGPGKVYDIVGGAPVGYKFVVVGKSTSTNYWIIQLQDGRECWLWGQYAVLEGNLSALPEYAIPDPPLAPVGSITGVVTDYAGTGIPGATVTAIFAEKSVQSGPQGQYTIDNLVPGPEHVSVRAPFYMMDKHQVTISQGRAWTENFVMISGIPGPPGPTVQVQGRVLLNGAPVAGASVSTWYTRAQAVTDINGWYTIDLLRVGDLIIARLGNTSGGVEVTPPENQTTPIMPDIILVAR
jgi:hypothetical protein